MFIVEITRILSNNISFCGWYNISRKHRIDELERGLDLIGTKNYETTGCYSCSGDDYDCSNFLPQKGGMSSQAIALIDSHDYKIRFEGV